MYVCVAGNGEMLVFFSFFPNNSLDVFMHYGVKLSSRKAKSKIWL